MNDVFLRHAADLYTAFLEAVMAGLVDFRPGETFEDEICMVCLEVR